jgi:hypothetical protein
VVGFGVIFKDRVSDWFKYLFFISLVFCSATSAYANSDYREFLACVDEILDTNQGMNPKVAEDICSDLLDKKDEDLGSTNYCDRLLKKF